MPVSTTCKINPSCDLVIPIDERSNIGLALTAINLNFENLENYTCNLSTSASNYWNSMYSTFSDLSANLESMLNIVQSHSACWNVTYDTVNTLSAFWLKPISLIYPYPFDEGAVGTSETVEDWLNEYFPVKSGDCYNFIVGQDMYVFTPEYKYINRVLTSSVVNTLNPEVTVINDGGIALRPPTPEDSANPAVGPFIQQTGNSFTVTLRGSILCIRHVWYPLMRLNVKINTEVGTIVPDQYIHKIVGLKYRIEPNTYRWIFDSNLYNLS